MDSQSNYSYSYEDDFEIPESTPPQVNPKVSGNLASPLVSRFESSPSSTKKRDRSFENYKSPARNHTPARAEPKSFKALEAENISLRSKLKSLNEEISNILTSLPSKKSYATKQPLEIKDARNSNRLKIYINEYSLIKEKFMKITDSEYLIQLRKEIKFKEDRIVSTEKEVKKLKKQQKTQGKSLEKAWVEDFAPTDMTDFGHLNEQLYKYKEAIENIETQQEKDYENYEKLYDKEIELNEKVEKLEKLQAIYMERNEGSTKDKALKDKCLNFKRQLEKVQMVGQGTLNKLAIQEKRLASELENIKKESNKTKNLLESKEKDSQVIYQELQAVANNISQHDMGHLLTFIKIKPDITEVKEKVFQSQPVKVVNDAQEQKSVRKSSPLVKKHDPFSELFKVEEKPVDKKSNEISDSPGKINLEALLGLEPESLIKPLAVTNSRTRKIVGNGPRAQPQLTEPKPEVVIKDAEKPTQFSSLLAELDPDSNSKPKILFTNPILPESPESTKPETDLSGKNIVQQFFTEKEKNPSSIYSNKRVSNTEKPATKSLLFAELEASSNKPSFLPIKELDSKDSRDEPALNQLKVNEVSMFKSPLLKELESEKSKSFFETEVKEQNSFRPKGRDRSHLLPKPQENQSNSLLGQEVKSQLFDSRVEEKEEKYAGFDIFNKFKSEAPKNDKRVGVVKPGVGDGGSLEKLKSMAERAENHNFFGDFDDKPTRSEPISFNGKLLPTKLEKNTPDLSFSSISPIRTEQAKPNIPQKPAFSKFELDEEDLLL